MAKTIAPRPTPAITGVQTTTQPQQIKIAIPQVCISWWKWKQSDLCIYVGLHLWLYFWWCSSFTFNYCCGKCFWDAFKRCAWAWHCEVRITRNSPVYSNAVINYTIGICLFRTKLRDCLKNISSNNNTILMIQKRVDFSVSCYLLLLQRFSELLYSHSIVYFKCDKIHT